MTYETTMSSIGQKQRLFSLGNFVEMHSFHSAFPQNFQVIKLTYIIQATHFMC